MKKLSLVMIVKDEERCIGRCLESVKEIVDEMIVVDTGSKDKTKEIALNMGAKVFDYKWNNDFAAARNYALRQSSGEWNLVLDADEYIRNVNQEALFSFMEDEKKLGRIKVVNILGSIEDVKYSQVFVSRLLPKGTYYVGCIHEQPNSQLIAYDVPIQVYHDGYLSQEIKVKRNLAFLKEQVVKSPRNSYLLYQLAYTLLLNKEYKVAEKYFKKFYQLVNEKASYRSQGIIYFIENYKYLGKFEEGHQLIQKEESRLQYYSQFYFVCAEFYREYVLSDVRKNIRYLPLVEACYLECLKIGENNCDGAIGTGTFLAAYNLGAWYEVSKQFDKAAKYYDMAIKWGYDKATERYRKVKKEK
nr:glycosyltransferase family 2 protein [uncultured Cellulosilyticum sp.]